jgi:hypothetical protein
MVVKSRFGRSSPRTIARMTPASTAPRSATPTRRTGTPIASMTAATATATQSRTPCRTPHPIEPRSHSPVNSAVPTTPRKTAKMTRAMASAPSATRRPTWPAIAPASALARSMWARTSSIAASRVAPIWAPRPGAGLRGPRGRDGGGVGFAFGSSRVVLRLRIGVQVDPDDSGEAVQDDTSASAGPCQRPCSAVRWRRWPSPIAATS